MLSAVYHQMFVNVMRRYSMISGFREYIAEYTVVIFSRYPTKRQVVFASALECMLSNTVQAPVAVLVYA